ncbi:MAG: hypothetical protein IJI85_10230 [Clostridia bacterium]|nr:hypothetical protein [Lentisphaeria bacterium]MBR0422937.1 hypothetical protein [Clostridia bacterium]
MKIACPSCKAQFEVEAQHAGKVAPCPQCGAQMQIPAPVAETVAAAPPAPKVEVVTIRKIAHGVALGLFEYSAICGIVALVCFLIFGSCQARAVNRDVQRAVQGIR